MTEKMETITRRFFDSALVVEGGAMRGIFSTGVLGGDFWNCCVGWMLRDRPLLRAAIIGQDRIYNEAVSLILSPPSGVSLVQVCPPANFRPGRFTRDPEVLQEGYEQGFAAAAGAISCWESL